LKLTIYDMAKSAGVVVVMKETRLRQVPDEGLPQVWSSSLRSFYLAA
jgi:hypothetical protein